MIISITSVKDFQAYASSQFDPQGSDQESLSILHAYRDNTVSGETLGEQEISRKIISIHAEEAKQTLLI